MRGISGLADDLLVYQEGLCSMGLTIYAINVSNPSGTIMRQEEYCVVG
jgi:hypothetical protein